jgi:Transposase and inactivated derivatives
MPRRSISQFDCVRIVTLCQEGLSTRDVSRHLGVNQSDVVRTWRRYRDTGTVDDMPRSGRPRATTAVDDRYLRISARRNPDSNATMLNSTFHATTGRHITTQTVRNRLHDALLHSRRPWRGPSLKPRHHAARYRWAQQHAEWTPRNWHHVLFTNECLICLQPDNCQLCVWRQPGQAEHLQNSVQRVQQGSGFLMFWGGIMWGRRMPLVVMDIGRILERYLSSWTTTLAFIVHML